MEITNLQRVFEFKKGREKVELPDPNPALSAQEVCKFYGATHPELTTAAVHGPVINNDKAVYSFSVQEGTLG